MHAQKQAIERHFCSRFGGERRNIGKAVIEPGEPHFWHVLALALGKTVGELKRTMTQREFRDWVTFYRAHPFDDSHRYHRPAALVAQSTRGGEIQPLLDWLHPPEWGEDFSHADINTLRALGIK